MILLLLMAQCLPLVTCTSPNQVNCATPTPVLQWDAVEHEYLEGYKVYAEESGGPLTLIATLLCEQRDLFIDDDETPDGHTRVCPGVDYGVPIQRFTNQGRSYNFTVYAYTSTNMQSETPSNMVEICTPPIYEVGSGLPYN